MNGRNWPASCRPSITADAVAVGRRAIGCQRHQAALTASTADPPMANSLCTRLLLA